MAESTMGANANKFPGASAAKGWLDGVMNSEDEEEAKSIKGWKNTKTN